MYGQILVVTEMAHAPVHHGSQHTRKRHAEGGNQDLVLDRTHRLAVPFVRTKDQETALFLGASGRSLSQPAREGPLTDYGVAVQSRTTVEFLPLDVGWKEGAIRVKAGDYPSQMKVVLFTANATRANDLAVQPEVPPPFEADFEETTEPIVFTVTNIGASPSGTITSVVVGEWETKYTITDTTCMVLAPAETCTISVVCSPPMSAAGGARDAILSVTDGTTTPCGSDHRQCDLSGLNHSLRGNSWCPQTRGDGSCENRAAVSFWISPQWVAWSRHDGSKHRQSASRVIAPGSGSWLRGIVELRSERRVRPTLARSSADPCRCTTTVPKARAT